MPNRSRSNMVFLPGGPCINGHYLDHFLTEGKINAKRLIYLNHESRYRLNDKATFNSICEDVLQQLRDLGSGLTFIGHSFGGMIGLSLLANEEFRSLVSKVILVSVPLSPDRTDAFYDSLKEMPLAEPRTNAEYSILLQKILPLYFCQESSFSQFSPLFVDSFFDGNQEANASKEKFEEIKDTFMKNKSSLYYVYGEGDKLLRQEDRPSVIPNQVFEIIQCGHFPMLEKPKEFTMIIEQILGIA